MFAPLPTPQEMAHWDTTAIQLGLPELLLMENASREAFHVLTHMAGTLQGKRILFFMGSGNNGGDAACLARHAHDAGAQVVLLHTRPLSSYKGVTGQHLRLARRCGVPCFPANRTRIPEPFTAMLKHPDIIVDGLLGTGFRGELRTPEHTLVQRINQLGEHAPVLSLDIPSGLSGLTGRPCPIAVRAHTTVTFEAAKVGLLLPEASTYIGNLHIRPIGIPRAVRENNPPQTQVLTSSIAQHLPYPEPHWHKGTAGHVLILAGSLSESGDLTGAAHLAAYAALRTGAGLVTVAAPAGIATAIKGNNPNIMTRPLGSPQATQWSPELLANLHSLLSADNTPFGALVLGCGLGRTPETASVVHQILSLTSRPPTVIDADALYALAQHPEWHALLRPCDILTPHPAEAARILQTTTQSIQQDRFAALHQLMELAPSVWLLKGAGTLIGMAGQPVTLSPYAESRLAVGGSGDVLAGCIGTLLAQRQHTTPQDSLARQSYLATCIGVWLHANAGQALSARFPHRGNNALEIADALCHVIEK